MFSPQPQFTAGETSSTATVVNVSDGNLMTFFNAPVSSGAWVGLDLGSAKVVTKVGYCPRPTWSSRMIGGISRVGVMWRRSSFGYATQSEPIIPFKR